MPELILALATALVRDPWSEPETIQAIIVTLGVTTTAMSGVAVAMIARTRSHAKAAADQVQNDHSSNLRDDLDDKFDSLTELVKLAVADIGGIKSDLRQIRKEAGEDREALSNERERIRRLEATSPQTPHLPKE